MDNSMLMLAIIIGFWLFLFVLLNFVLRITAYISGWKSLSAQYATTRLTTVDYTYQSGMVGWISYNNILQVGITPAGLYLAMPKFFSFGHAPLLVPWTQVKYISTIKVLWQLRLNLQVGSKTILLSGKCADKMRLYIMLPNR